MDFISVVYAWRTSNQTLHWMNFLSNFYYSFGKWTVSKRNSPKRLLANFKVWMENAARWIPWKTDELNYVWCMEKCGQSNCLWARASIGKIFKGGGKLPCLGFGRQRGTKHKLKLGTKYYIVVIYKNKMKHNTFNKKVYFLKITIH